MNRITKKVLPGICFSLIIIFSLILNYVADYFDIQESNPLYLLIGFVFLGGPTVGFFWSLAMNLESRFKTLSQLLIFISLAAWILGFIFALVNVFGPI